MKRPLAELFNFWKKPANARYILLVVAASYVLMYSLWDIHHGGASREFVFTNAMYTKEAWSLVRNVGGAVAGGLVLWTVLGFVWARRRRAPLEEGLRRIALGFLPALLAGLGVAANVLGCDDHLARAIQGISAACVAAWLWAEMGLWPFKIEETEPHGPRFYAAVMAGAIAVYVAMFSWLSIARYLTFYAALNDLGMYTQQLWGNLHGHWFLCSTYALKGDTMLAEHFMPLIVVLTPFYAIWQDPRTILVVQAMAVGLAALPLYAISIRLGLDRRAGILIAMSYLLHPLVQTGNLYDFHPDAFVPLLSTSAFWSLLALDDALRVRKEENDPQRPFPWRYLISYALFTLLWLSYKEDSLFGVGLLGFYALVFRRRPAIGIVTMAAGIGWGAAAMGWIIPHFRGEPYSHIDRYFYLVKPFGWTPDQGSFFVEFVKVSLMHPFYMLGQIFTPDKITALLKLFGPVLFLAFFGPKELLIAVPAIGLNLLSGGYEQYEFRLHYPFSMMAFVYISALAGLRNISAWLGRKPERVRGEPGDGKAMRRRSQLGFAAAAFLVAVGMCRWFGETPLSRTYGGPEKVWRTDHHRLAASFLQAVPADASLAAQTGLAAHATHRLEIYEFPYLNRDPQYILLSARMHPWPLSLADYARCVGEILDAGVYGVVKYEDGYILLRRGHSTELNASAKNMIQQIVKP